MSSALHKNLGLFFDSNCSLFEDRAALGFKKNGRIVERTYNELGESATRLALGLRQLGLESGDTCALFADTSVEWLYSLIAIHLCGAVDVTAPRSTDLAVQAKLAVRCECSICITDRLELAEELKENSDIRVVLITSNGAAASPEMIDFHHLLESDYRDFDRELEKMRQGLSEKRLPDEPASIFFKRQKPDEKLPRGIVLTNRNILKNIESLSVAMPASELDRLYNCNSFDHCSGRFALLYAIRNGCCLFPDGSDAKLQNELREFTPTIAVLNRPLLEDIYRQLSGNQQRRFYHKISNRYLQATATLTERFPIFQKKASLYRLVTYLREVIVMLALWPLQATGALLFRHPLRRQLGGHLKTIITGGTPLPTELEFFFQALEITLLQVYWLPEAAHALACRVPKYYHQAARLTLGTVGPILPETQLQILDKHGEDVTFIPGVRGVIYVRGPQVMAGYFREPGRTSEVLDEQGWLNSGDIGRLTINGELQLLEERQSSEFE